MKLAETITYLLMMVFVIGFFALINDAVISLDASGWSFTGSELAASIFPAVPYIFLTVGLAFPIYKIVKEQS